jgi:membrane protein YqaA with SNARE-associated domain
MRADIPVIDESPGAVAVPSGDGAGGQAAPHGDAVPLGSGSLRIWFVTYLLWMAVLVVGAQMGFWAWRHGQPAGLPVWAICLGAFYMSLANNLMPLPTMWMVMLLASNIVALPGSVPVRIAYVAAVTAVATGMANLNEYHVLRWALGSRAAGRVRRTRLVQWAIRWFRTNPFGILTLASFAPIPIDAVRWIAIADGYSRWRFFWANAAGRWVRYALVAGATVWLNAGIRTIVGVQAGVLVVAGVGVVTRAVRQAKDRGGEVVLGP